MLRSVELYVEELGRSLSASPPEILVAYPIVGRKKLDRLMQVAQKTAVTVSLDSLFVARQLSDAARAGQIEIGILAEVDVGLGRVGVAPGEALLQLIQGIDRLPHLRFEGIAFYPGMIRSLDEEGEEALKRLAQLLDGILRDVRRAGFQAKIFSGGFPPTLFHSHSLPRLHENRPSTV